MHGCISAFRQLALRTLGAFALGAAMSFWGVPAGASVWSLVPVPLPAGSIGAALGGVSCTATTACTAVGGSSDSSGVQLPLAEGWDGARWSVQSTPAFSHGSVNGLIAVSCVSAGWCMAAGNYSPVGSNVPSTLTEVRDGTGWAIVPSPSPGARGPDAEFTSVSCVSASACMAAGDYFDGSSLVGLAEWWDGSSWSVVSVPEPTGTIFARLFGVSCTAASACTAVGTYATSASNGLTLVERWDGSSWSIQPSPNPAGASESGLKGVSCVSTSVCTAVGVVAESDAATLVERWDGSSWLIEPGPNPGSAGNGFAGVACAGVGTCGAVGSQVSGSGPGEVLAEGWDGTSWSVQGTPAPSDATSELRGVSCLAASWCQAVGWLQSTANGSFQAPLAQVYAAGPSPSISTRASAGVPLGGQVHDTATLTGGQTPSGWIVFKLYAPGDTTCSLGRAFTSRVPVHGDGSYTSASFTPTRAGTYRFTATYIGDKNNNPASGACGAAGEQVVVSRLTPLLGTTASGTVAAGGQVHDTARLLGGRAPTGTIIFRLYRPGDGTCSIAPVFKSTVTVTGDGSYPSASFTATKAGTYRFTATYSGDQNNAPLSKVCGASGEQVTVTRSV